MIVLGLDVSYTATGWVALQADDETADEQPTVLAHGKVATEPIPKEQRAEAFLRCARIWRVVEGVLAPINQHRPNLIGIEDYSYESVDGAHLTGELHGVLMYWLWRTNQVVDRVPIGTWRRLALGNGQTPKETVCAEVLKRYAVEFRTRRGALDVDITEAFGVAVAAWMRRIGADKPVRMRRRSRAAAELPVLAHDPFA